MTCWTMRGSPLAALCAARSEPGPGTAMKKRILFLAAVCTATILPIVLVGSPISFVPLCFLAAVALLSFFYTAALAAAFRLGLPSERVGRCERQARTEYHMMAENRGFFICPNILLSLRMDNEQGFPPEAWEHHFMLAPRERRELTFPVCFSHVGLYRLKVERICFYGFLGFLRLTRRPRWNEQVRVMPKRFPMNGFDLDTSHSKTAVDFSAPGRIEEEEYTDVREYEPGDSMKNIHWKLSAHTGVYMTRRMDSDAVSGVTIYLDFSLPAGREQSEMPDLYDCIAESAFSLALHAINRGYCAELVYYSGGELAVIPVSGAQMLEDVMASLPPMSAQPDHTLGASVVDRSGRPDSFDNIAVLTGTMEDQLLDALVLCGRRGKFPLLCFCQGAGAEGRNGESASAVQKASARGIAAHAIASARQLSEYFGGMG